MDLLLRIVGEASGPKLLILGGVHGDEFEPIMAIRRLAEVIDRSRLAGQLVLVPIANAPAFKLQQRCGPDGLDLARTFPGNVQGGETERIAAQLTALISECDFLIDLHTGGRAMTIWPLTGYMLCDDGDLLEVQRRMARAFGLPLTWGTSARLEGRSLSAARDMGKPAIYAEWGGGGGCDPAGVEAYVQGCLNVMIELKMYASPLSVDPIPMVIEDHRYGSGHLQANYPAPLAGFYQSAQPLGRVISEGTLLGSIWSSWNQPVTEVRAAGAGLLIVNRTLPAVSEGDALATILETDGDFTGVSEDMASGDVE